MCHGSVMERCYGSVMESDVSRKCCVTEASWKGVMEVVCLGSAMERRHRSDAPRKRHGKVSRK